METKRRHWRYWQFRNGSLSKTSFTEVAWFRRYFPVYEAWDRQLAAWVYYDGGKSR